MNHKILILDNFDSFTYNLYQSFLAFTKNVKVIRNDNFTLLDLKEMEISHLVISPGPKTPNDCGSCIKAVDFFKNKIPILGVCLGHQILAYYFGASIVQSNPPVHGKTALIDHNHQGLFKNIEQKMQVARYHSLEVSRQSIPKCLDITASYNNIVMAIQHKEFPSIVGVQFHPESFLTKDGSTLIKNFLNMRC